MAASDRTNVLVIDDEYGARLQVELAILGSDRLELAGQASNGMRGAELAEQLQPGVIVLDLAMPVMDGFEALPLLRTVAPTAAIVVRSSNDEPDVAERVKQLGAVRFLPKFLSPDELCDVIEAVATPPVRAFGDGVSLRTPRYRRPRMAPATQS